MLSYRIIHQFAATYATWTHATCVDRSDFYIMHYQTANFRYILFMRRVVWEDLLRNEILCVCVYVCVSTMKASER